MPASAPEFIVRVNEHSILLTVRSQGGQKVSFFSQMSTAELRALFRAFMRASTLS